VFLFYFQISYTDVDVKSTVISKKKDIIDVTKRKSVIGVEKGPVWGSPGLRGLSPSTIGENVYEYMYIYVSIYLCIHMYICMHTYIYIYIWGSPGLRGSSPSTVG
jgi:hypothetical protein